MKISIIIPCYNGGPFLEQSIKSCLGQDYDNTEVIFVDNESTDDSLSVATKIQEEHPELIISSAPNIYKYTASEPVGVALKMMSGDYFTIVGADDFLSEEYVSNVVNKITSSDVDVSCMQSAICRLAPNDKEQRYDGQMVGYEYGSIDELKSLLLKYCCVNTPSVFYKRTLYEEGMINWDPKKYLGAEDYDLYFQFADKGIFIHTYNEWLGYFYRLHEGQATWGMVNEARIGNNFDSKIKSYWGDKWKK